MNRTTLPMKRVVRHLSLRSINLICLPLQGNYNRQDVSQPDDCSWHPDQTVIVPHEEQKKKWRELDDNRRKQLKVQISFILNPCRHSRVLQIGGGLLAGAATIGAGYHAWDENKKARTEEEVGLLLSHSDFSLLTRVEETSSHVGFAEMAA